MTCSLLVSAFFINASTLPTAQIAIIVDDMGGKPNDDIAFSLDKNITFSILPHTPYSTEFSYRAAQQNREVMLHMPMESLNDNALGEGPILSNMYPQQIQQALMAALATVPHAVGVNNHMGSKVTQMTLPMQSVMRVLSQNNLFFVDSRTTRFTKARSIANQYGVTTASRHVFLDHLQTMDFLQQQFDLLIAKGRKHGKAIGIAHPHEQTLAFLHNALDDLPEDVVLITVSQYLQETDKFRINPKLARASQQPIQDTQTQLESVTPD
jgi:polysaccharide deacetylase 2 family uncharacterized protein YibQ|nr:divergent polysaccharide deacetylase family protein [Glaciecola sp. XM2]